MRIAVNHPYFIPYAGYFRLFASTDLVVLFDCVPFPRRGYVHRNQLPDVSGEAGWFTLPVKKKPRDTCIRDMEFADKLEQKIKRQINRFPIFETNQANANPLADLCMNPAGDLVDYLIRTLQITTGLLGLPFNVIRSSSLELPAKLRGEARVLRIVEMLGGSVYLNAPGGRHLYDAQKFANAGIELRYLEYYQGSHWSILYRILSEAPASIRKEIIKQSNCIG